MRFAQVEELFKKRPFAPLLVRVVSGTEYRITHPDCIVTPRYAAFVLESGVIEFVALEYIEAIRPLPGNGQRPARSRRKRR